MSKLNSFCGALVGRRKTGKTFLTMQILRSGMFKKYNFEFIIILSPTLALQPEPWKMITPQGILIVNSLNERLVQKVIKYQKLKKPQDRKHILIIGDDLGLQSRQTGQKAGGNILDYLAFAGRHHNISTIQLCQKYAQMTPSYRSQLDWFFWAGSSNNREVSAVHQEYGDRDINSFRRKINQTFTKEYAWLYFKNIGGKMVVTEL